MESIIKSDVFFFVSSIAFAIIASLMIVVLIYAIKIIRTLSEIMDEVKKKALQLSTTLDDIEKSIEDSTALRYLSFFFNRKGKSVKESKSRSKTSQ